MKSYTKEKSKSTKKKYVTPKIDIYYVDMEGSISVSSATINPGSVTNVPTVTDWEEKKVEQNWNF